MRIPGAVPAAAVPAAAEVHLSDNVSADIASLAHYIVCLTIRACPRAAECSGTLDPHIIHNSPLVFVQLPPRSCATGHPRKPFFFHLFFELRIIGTVYNLLECCRLTGRRRDLVFGPAFHILLFCIIFYANLESLVPLDFPGAPKTLKALL